MTTCAKSKIEMNKNNLKKLEAMEEVNWGWERSAFLGKPAMFLFTKTRTLVFSTLERLKKG